MSEPAPSLLALFGVDAGGRTHGSRFEPPEFEAAAEAAIGLGMFTLKVEKPELVELVGQLPRGKLFKSGSAFVPFVGKKLYDQLLAAGEAAGAALTRPATTPAARPRGPASKPAAAPGEASKAERVTLQPKSLPIAWGAIEVGAVVLVADSIEDGYFPAVVQSIDEAAEPEDRLLVVRFRDYRDYPALSRKARDVALIHPSAVDQLRAFWK